MKSFEEVLDDCIDRIGRGQSVEDCLRLYPEYAQELGLYLRLVLQIQTEGWFEPSEIAKDRGRMLLGQEMARGLSPETKTRGTHWWQKGWGKIMAPVAAALALAIIVYGALVGIVPGLTPEVYAGGLEMVGTGLEENTEVSAVWVTVSEVSVRRAGEGGWINVVDAPMVINLLDPEQTRLVSTKLDSGKYEGISLRVDRVVVVIRGIKVEAELKGPTQVNLEDRFEVKAGKTTVIKLNFGDALELTDVERPACRISKIRMASELRHGMPHALPRGPMTNWGLSERGIEIAG